MPRFCITVVENITRSVVCEANSLMEAHAQADVLLPALHPELHTERSIITGYTVSGGAEWLAERTEELKT